MGKVAGQRVTFRAPARIGAIAASLAAAAALLLPTTALAATTEIGSTLGGAFVCTNHIDYVQISTSGLSGTYTVLSSGMITSWTIQVGTDTGPAALEVWRPTPPSLYTLVGISPTLTLKPSALNDILLTESISVQPGDLIGLKLEGDLACAQQTGNPLDTIGSTYFGPPAALNVSEPLSIDYGYQLNVAATVTVTVNPPPPPPTLTSADQCKHGGWQGLTDGNGTLFKNQGDCVSFVATNGTNLAG
jgi:hypothetical protein